jgi:hypothetical protein
VSRTTAPTSNASNARRDAARRSGADRPDAIASPAFVRHDLDNVHK